MEAGDFSPSQEGTPQGGVVSPLLANIALDGLERELQKAYTAREGKPTLIRYADDFVVLHPTLNGVDKARKTVEAWLATIGLKWNPKKTTITHTLTAHEGTLGFGLPSVPRTPIPGGQTPIGQKHPRK